MPRVRTKELTDWRAQKLADWIEDTGRKVGWVASRLERSKVWISYILNGHYSVSEGLAEKIENEFGLDMGVRQAKLDAHK